MRAIGRVDIDSVVKDVDIDTLQVRHPTTSYFERSGLARSDKAFSMKMAEFLLTT